MRLVWIRLRMDESVISVAAKEKKKQKQTWVRNFTSGAGWGKEGWALSRLVHLEGKVPTRQRYRWTGQALVRVAGLWKNPTAIAHRWICITWLEFEAPGPPVPPIDRCVDAKAHSSGPAPLHKAPRWYAIRNSILSLVWAASYLICSQGPHPPLTLFCRSRYIPSRSKRQVLGKSSSPRSNGREIKMLPQHVLRAGDFEGDWPSRCASQEHLSLGEKNQNKDTVWLHPILTQ